MRPSSKIEKEKGRIFQSPSRKNLHSTLVCMPLDNVFSRDNRGLPHFMDEPTAGLDTVFRQDFLRILQDFIADYEATILMSTHIEEDLNGIADYIIEVDNGKCILSDNL